MSVAPIEKLEISAAPPANAARGRGRRLEDPLGRLYREPVARRIAQALAGTRVMPDQLLFGSALFASAAALLVSFDRPAYLVGAALALELRALLEHASAELVRARSDDPEPAAVRARRAAVSWLGVLLLYAGLICHFTLHPPGLAWVVGVVLLSGWLARGASRRAKL